MTEYSEHKFNTNSEFLIALSGLKDKTSIYSLYVFCIFVALTYSGRLSCE